MCAASTIACLIALTSPVAGAAGSARPPAAAARVLKTFDFDERRLGNYETSPMNWRPVRGLGHPRFLEARFDHEMGRTAPPSFRFDLAGGSLAAHYLARDIAIQPGCDYEVEAYVRPRGLVHSRAFITAYYLDHAMRIIESSRATSRAVTSAPGPEAWMRIVVRLPTAAATARWIGLACHLEQAALSGTTPFAPRTIVHHDVHAAAWFDDIVVRRLPSARLVLDSRAGVVGPREPVRLLAGVSDIHPADLSARLEVTDAAGRVVAATDVAARMALRLEPVLELRDASAGRYVARLRVASPEHQFDPREIAFVRLGPDRRRPTASPTGFGVILDGPPADDVDGLLALLDAALPAAVKVPVWSSTTSDVQIVSGDRNLDRLIDKLRVDQVPLVAVLQAPPPSLTAALERPNSTLVEILGGPPAPWRPYLALVAARLGQRAAAWQIGADAPSPWPDAEQTAPAVAQAEAVLRPLIGTASVLVPHDARVQIGCPPARVDLVSLTVPPSVPPESVADQIRACLGSDGTGLWAALIPADPSRFDRRARLINLARRLIAARLGGAEIVFIPQPWQHRPGEDGWDPSEVLLLARTLNQYLGGLSPARRLWLGPGLAAWLFEQPGSDEGTVVAWTDADGPGGRAVTLDAGLDTGAVDAWGNPRSVSAGASGVRVELDAFPTFLHPVSSIRMRLLAGLAVDEPEFQPGPSPVLRTLTLENPFPHRLSGVLHLEVPAGWRIEPAHLTVDADAKGVARMPIELRTPVNLAEGDYQLVARLEFDQAGPRTITLRAPLRARAPGLEVSVLTAVRSGALEIVHRITNRTAATLDLRTDLIAPVAPRQGSLIRGLASGQTAVRTYRLPVANDLAGKPVRVSVEQIGGPLRSHRLVTFD